MFDIMYYMRISIVIPAYNCETYLKRCVSSIMAAMDNYDGSGEVIIVNNNSTDGTDKIIKGLIKNYPKRIKCENCITPGAAAVRNFGAKKATGDYIWFVDADDTIRNDAITRLLSATDSGKNDMVMLGVKRVYADSHTDYLSAVRPEEKDFKSRFVRYGLGPFQVLIKRRWWQHHGFVFQEGMIHEDMGLMSALILFTNHYNCVDEPLYNYYQNAESVLHKSSWDPHYLDIFPALKSLYSIFKKERATSRYHDELEWFFIWNLLIDSAKDFSKFKEGRVGFKMSREMLRSYFPRWRSNRFLKQKPLKLRLRVLLNYYKH